MTQAECRVTDICCELLGTNDVSLDANFFDIGGDSLRGMHLVARLSEELGRKVRFRTLSENPVLADFARELEKDDQDASDARAAAPGDPLADIRELAADVRDAREAAARCAAMRT